MTYVLGLNQFNINTIICDMRVTWYKQNKIVRGENVGLKSGFLFPGCMYAISGSVDDARRFIIDCKYNLRSPTLPELWEEFTEFVRNYPFRTDKDSHFELLLSTRNNGNPQFYTLDSMTSKIEHQNAPISLGTGKEILDDKIGRLVSINTDIINKMVSIEKRLPKSTFPYLYCHWLNEISQGTDLLSLEKYHVGGIFHFLYQDINNESWQGPAVYVLSSADPKSKTIYSWIYRVTYARGALVVSNPVKNVLEIFTDTAADPQVESIQPSRLKDDIIREADAQPYHYFCGFGFSDPKHRGEMGIAITNEGKYVVDKTGNISPFFRKKIAEKFSRDYKMS